MKMYALWALLFVTAEAIITVFQLLLRKKKIKRALHITLIIVKALLSIAFATLVMAGPVVLRPVQPIMIALYAALLTDALADIVYSIFCVVKKTEPVFKWKKLLSIALGVLFFIYGTANMQIVKPNYHTYTSDKLSKEHKIVFASDIHVGSAQNFSTLEKAVEAMAAENPECIILCGDITDDYTTNREMHETYQLFGSLGIPVYYLHGNHDRQKHAEYAHGMQYTADDLEQAIVDNGIILLKDEYVVLDDDLVLLGREDISEGGTRKDAAELKNPYPEKYLILADHQPFEFKDNLVCGTDLQLSGHTHAGQLFPLKALYSVIGYAYGDFYEGDAVMNVSSGACGWRVPFRTDSHCHFEVVTLKPTE